MVSIKKLANTNLMQVYIEFLIWFGSSRSKLLAFLNQSWSICGWTILSLVVVTIYSSNVHYSQFGLQHILYIHTSTKTFTLARIPISNASYGN